MAENPGKKVEVKTIFYREKETGRERENNFNLVSHKKMQNKRFEARCHTQNCALLLS